MAKKFLLFAGADYYPGGGFHDLIDSFGSVDEAQAAVSCHDEWAQVVKVGDNGGVRLVVTGRNARVGQARWTWTPVPKERSRSAYAIQ